MELLEPAFRLLMKYRRTPAGNLKLLVTRYLSSGRFQDNPGITRTVYGVIRKERILDQIIERYSGRTLEKLDGDVVAILQIGIYLLVFSRSYAEYAVVNGLVEMTPKRAKKFVNGVLRNLAREKRKVETLVGNIKAPAIKYSISDVLVKHLALLGIGLEESLSYVNREPQFHYRVNPLHMDYGRLREILDEAEVTYDELNAFQSIGITGYGKVLQKLLKSKSIYLQNTASQLVAAIAARYCGDRVLDCCAAPGTKAVTLGLLRPGVEIVANDVSHRRMKLLKEFVEDMGIDGVWPMVSDIRTAPFSERFDFIMADAPCSSAGTLRKNPDLKLKIDEETVARNSTLQSEILRALCPVTAPGGYLLYAVCSFIKEETEDIMALLEEDGEFEAVVLSPILDEFGFHYKKGRWGVYLQPHLVLNNDLFYLSLVRKRAG